MSQLCELVIFGKKAAYHHKFSSTFTKIQQTCHLHIPRIKPTMELDKQRRALEKATDLDLFYTSFLQSDDSRQSIDDLSAHVDIESAFDELRQLKTQHVALSTGRLFMQEVLKNQPIETVATAKDAAMAEASLRENKEKVRAIKSKRSATEKRLPDLIGELVECERLRQMRASKIRRRMLKEQAAVRSSEVFEAIQNRDIDTIESLVSHIDEVDENSCQTIIQFLRAEEGEVHRHGTSSRSRVDAFRKEVEEDMYLVEGLERRANELQSKLQVINSSVQNAQAIRADITLQEQSALVLHSLIGVHVREVRTDGLSIAIKAMLFVPECTSVDRSRTTHLLDFEFKHGSDGDAHDGTQLYDVMLQPSDVSVRDLGDVTFPLAVQTVVKRLGDFMREKHASATR